MTQGFVSVYIDGTQYDESVIRNFYMKDKLNQVGRFEFDMVFLNDSDITRVKENTIIYIYIKDTCRMQGFIKKITHDKSTRTRHVEGESLAGILAKKRDMTPAIFDISAPHSKRWTKNIAAEVIFNRCGFYHSGPGGWKIIGADGVNHFHYNMENRTALDHVVQLAKISNTDWRCYIE